MEKILVSKYGDMMAFDTETNALSNPPENINCNGIYKCTKQGQIITKKEVIDINPGEYVLRLSAWGVNGEDLMKCIVISDPTVVHDLDVFWGEVEKANVKQPKVEE